MQTGRDVPQAGTLRLTVVQAYLLQSQEGEVSRIRADR